jgi:hypothetical protein
LRKEANEDPPQKRAEEKEFLLFPLIGFVLFFQLMRLSHFDVAFPPGKDQLHKLLIRDQLARLSLRRMI